MTKLTRVGILLTLAWFLHTAPARASFHLMMVVEVFPGYASSPNAQYVELQMYSPGQNLVAGHSVPIFDGAGTAIGTFTFPPTCRTAGTSRTFTIVGPTCGVPADATAVSLNVTVVQPTAGGNIRLFPAGGAAPSATTVNYTTGLTRANNALVGLSAAGELTVRSQQVSGSTHLALDVNGYFTP